MEIQKLNYLKQSSWVFSMPCGNTDRFELLGHEAQVMNLFYFLFLIFYYKLKTENVHLKFFEFVWKNKSVFISWAANRGVVQKINFSVSLFLKAVSGSDLVSCLTDFEF